MVSKKVLVMTVGGSPQPLIYSINNIKPDLVYFIYTKETFDCIKLIISKTNGYKYLKKQLKDHESLDEAYKLSKDILRDLHYHDFDNIIIDFTGGTKPMVSGLILAATGDKYTNSSEYIYVGSINGDDLKSRNKNGVGTVENGFESIKIQNDPYETYALLEFRRGKNFFNNYQFEAALKNFETAKSKLVDSNLKKRAGYYINLVKFYQCWDKFNNKIDYYNNIAKRNEKSKLPIYLEKELIDNCPKKLLEYDFKNVDNFIEQLKNNLKFLKLKILNDVKSSMFYYLPDLLNNAYRKIEIGFYDDAVARLYRAIELIAQIRLNDYDLIDLNRFQTNKIFYINREKFDKTVDDDVKSLVMSFGISDYFNNRKAFRVHKSQAYNILMELGDNVAIELDNNKQLNMSVNKRNNSILAHGLNPMNKKDAIDLYEKVLNNSKLFYPDITKYMEFAKFPKIQLK